MMPSRLHIGICRMSGVATAVLAVTCTVVFGYGFMDLEAQSAIRARLTQRSVQVGIPWITITEENVRDGITAQPDAHILLHIPVEIRTISRRTLFGRRGQEVRYWGYCLPHQSSPTRLDSAFPGPMFLSEEEERFQVNRIREEEGHGRSIYKNLTNRGVNSAGKLTGPIQHDKNVFFGGDTCYLMTEAPLPVGIDVDGDGLNSHLERTKNTDPNDTDTDDDTVGDGQEVFTLFTIPTAADSDGDGLSDGIEDANGNGRYDAGETSPTNIDTDNDGLCDGHCIFTANGTEGFVAPKGFVPKDGTKQTWEDKNLNGVVDDNETSPILVDTDGDGILDEQEFFLCILSTGSGC